MDILTISLHYFRTGEFKAIAEQMDETYNPHPLNLNSESFLTPIRETKHSFEQAKKILKRLNIPELQWKHYLDCGSVYGFLEELAKNGIEQANELLNAIDAKRATGKLQLILGVLFSAVLIALLLLSPPMAGVLASFQAFLGSATSISIISLFYTGSIALYSAYQNQFDRRRTLMDRFIDNFFLLAAGALNVTGYIILIGASAVMSPVVGALFVAGAAVDVVKSVVALVREYLNYNAIVTSPSNNVLANQQAAVRHELAYNKHRNELIISLSSAVILVGLMAVWSFVPGGLFVTAAVLISIGVVYAAKAVVSKYNEKDIREKLQQELNELEKTAEPAEKAELEQVDQLQNLNSEGARIEPLSIAESYIASATQTHKVNTATRAHQPKTISQEDMAKIKLGFFKDAAAKPLAANKSAKSDLDQSSASSVPGGK